jgi:hypothetical protein
MEKLGTMNKPESIHNVDKKGCSLCLHKPHQMHTWLKEMLAGNITILLSVAKRLENLLHLQSQWDFINDLFLFMQTNDLFKQQP